MSTQRSGRPTGLLERAHALDVEVYRRIAATSTPAVDGPLRRLSVAANYSRISVASAAVLAACGGARGRRAACTGLASVAVTSASVNLVAKLLSRRTRPLPEVLGVLLARTVTMPTSTSFPSGHAAAAVAFAAGVGHEWPAAARPLTVVAGLVAYSRVHVGVHYPGDVLVGAAIGAGLARLTASMVDRTRARGR